MASTDQGWLRRFPLMWIFNTITTFMAGIPDLEKNQELTDIIVKLN